MLQFVSATVAAYVAATLVLLGGNEATPSFVPSEPIASTTIDENMLLPDLVAQPVRVLYVSHDGITGEHEMRFSTTIANIGEGPLDLIGSYDEETGSTVAMQNIYHKTDALTERIAGHFIFHPDHHHWHFEDFAVLELYTYEEDGSLDLFIGSTEKLTFCIFDSNRVTPTVPHVAETSAYPGCDSSARQGISSGWEDTYAADLPGQELNIEKLPPGRYAIREVADPLNRILESDETNNVTITYVEISENGVFVIEPPVPF